jgi:hypothetical protein
MTSMDWDLPTGQNAELPWSQAAHLEGKSSNLIEHFKVEHFFCNEKCFLFLSKLEGYFNNNNNNIIKNNTNLLLNDK